MNRPPSPRGKLILIVVVVTAYVASAGIVARELYRGALIQQQIEQMSR